MWEISEWSDSEREKILRGFLLTHSASWLGDHACSLITPCWHFQISEYSTMAIMDWRRYSGKCYCTMYGATSDNNLSFVSYFRSSIEYIRAHVQCWENYRHFVPIFHTKNKLDTCWRFRRWCVINAASFCSVKNRATFIFFFFFRLLAFGLQCIAIPHVYFYAYVSYTFNETRTILRNTTRLRLRPFFISRFIFALSRDSVAFSFLSD